MPAKKQVAQRLSDDHWRELAPRIWDLLPEATYEWEISPTAEARLKALAGIGEASGGANALGRNRDLRDRIGPLIAVADPTRLYELARWIIRDWGRIPGGVRGDGADPLMLWAARLHGVEPDTVTAFIKAQGNDRIPSWSKLLSFIDVDTYAIYDTRVSVTLNIALVALGEQLRFYHPDGRNNVVARAAAVLGRVRDPLSYFDYLALLRGLVAERGQTFLSAETRLFAVAPQIAKSYINAIDSFSERAAAIALDVRPRTQTSSDRGPLVT